MRIGNIEVKRRVWITLLATVVVTGAWWEWSRTRPQGIAAAKPVPQPLVRLTGIGVTNNDEVLRERAELFDPTPLFFPTKWNYGQQPLRQNLRRQPGQVFGSFEAKPAFDDQNLKSYGAETTPAPEKLSDVLAQGNEAPLAGIGQIELKRAPLAERAGFLEIKGLFGDKTVMAQEITGISVPRLDYTPLEFLVLIGSAGVVGEPILTSGSGWNEVDGFFRTYLVKTFRLGERLTPGRYRVLIGP